MNIKLETTTLISVWRALQDIMKDNSIKNKADAALKKLAALCDYQINVVRNAISKSQ